ncbi:unnamed protein product, partial [Phaeothamnion confervicola]
SPGGVQLSLGARGTRVRGLQIALVRRRIVVDIDGVFGPGTRKGVVRVQRRLGLAVSGTADADLLRRIEA